MEKEIKVKGNKLKVLIKLNTIFEDDYDFLKIYGVVNEIEYLKDFHIGDRMEIIEGNTGICRRGDEPEKNIIANPETITLNTEFDEKIIFRTQKKGTFEIITYKFI